MCLTDRSRSSFFLRQRLISGRRRVDDHAAAALADPSEIASGLEYRFIDRDLILWDPHANLIIDFIPHALSLSDES
jgi:hypothetical protein